MFVPESKADGKETDESDLMVIVAPVVISLDGIHRFLLVEAVVDLMMPFVAVPRADAIG